MPTQILFIDLLKDLIAPAKRIRVKANSKPWFNNQIISEIQRRNKLYKKFKRSGLETDKDNFKPLTNIYRKNFFKKILL